MEFNDDLEEVLNDSITKPAIQTGTLAPSPTPADATLEPIDHGMDWNMQILRCSWDWPNLSYEVLD
jgi:hypothetical protein